MTGTKTIRIDYVAVFRAQRGLTSETRATEAATLRALYDELKREFGFSLTCRNVRVAVADEFCDWDASLKEGDKVVFIPPVAGG